MILSKISTDWDLSESGVEHACESLYERKNGGEGSLYVSSAGLKDGRAIARKYHLILFLDDDLPPDAWYVKDKWFGVFSPGA